MINIVLYVIGLIVLSLIGTLLVMSIVYLILNFTHKLIITSYNSIKPSKDKEYKTTPGTNTTGKFNKIHYFICGFLHFWCPFERIEQWIFYRYCTQYHNTPQT